MFKMTSATGSGSPRHRFSKKWWVLIGVVAVVGIVAVLELTNTTHFFHKSIPATLVVVKKGKATPAPKNNASAGVSTQSSPTSGAPGDRTIGGATDTNGSSSTSNSSSQWTISKSGNITLKQPIVNAKLQSGSIIGGSAKVDSVNFRLIDNQVGVISQGVLNVVNGNFSGTLQFTPHASTGRLDVFSTDSKGVELNEVQISVNF